MVIKTRKRGGWLSRKEAGSRGTLLSAMSCPLLVSSVCLESQRGRVVI